MPTSPLVSIVMPVFNDQDWISAALDSCLGQTTSEIEIICVDDASTDGTRGIIEDYQRRDPRVRLVAQQYNRSAFQARRTGIHSAAAPYILFLDGDDELASRAVEVALRTARTASADVVGFGVEVISDDGRSLRRFERTLQPEHARLSGGEIMAGLFPVGKPAQGHLWRYLFKTELLRDAYASFPADLTIYRANDLPITFLAMAAAKTYVSTPEKLYRYRFGRGTSGQKITAVDDFRFYLGAIESIERIEAQVEERAAGQESSTIVDSYASARLSIIGNILKYCVQNAAADVQGECVALLQTKVEASDIVRAAVTFYPDALPLLARHLTSFPSGRDEVRHVLLTTGNLHTGGVQTVLVEQAGYLREAGFEVSVAVHNPNGVAYALPDDVQLLFVEGGTREERLDSWAQMLREHEVDVIIDHHILYNDRWPFQVLTARAVGVPTIGWLHNFALRPLFDSQDRTSFLVDYLPLLRDVVVLSPTDVSFWKLRGIEHAIYLPNPPSSMLRELPMRAEPKTVADGPIELAWWGRLQQSTKQVRELIVLAEKLRRLGVEFRLTIIGPDGDDVTAQRLRYQAEAAGVSDAVYLPGPLHGEELIRALSSAHVFVSASVIEGYQLTILEAQAMGMPVVLYELPWLLTLEDNDGAIAVRQGDSQGLAECIAGLVRDPARYGQLSAASLDAAHRMQAYDFPELYANLVRGALAPEFSPVPTLEHARLLLEWAFFYAERNARARNRLARNFEREKRQHQQIREGASFRLGRILTYFPRKLRGK